MHWCGPRPHIALCLRVFGFLRVFWVSSRRPVTVAVLPNSRRKAPSWEARMIMPRRPLRQTTPCVRYQGFAKLLTPRQRWVVVCRRHSTYGSGRGVNNVAKEREVQPHKQEENGNYTTQHHKQNSGAKKTSAKINTNTHERQYSHEGARQQRSPALISKFLLQSRTCCAPAARRAACGDAACHPTRETTASNET